ncbi:MAG TPA: nucleotidyltransferase domain-containing protein [Ilumatobacteraceae bacterium]|nr:nucleotidyltransferase domain-containing protein [Ilumatobacteraceae bacterium]
MEPVLQAPALEALATWLDAHDEVAPGVVEGLYVVGSAVLGDWTSHSDIDVVAVVADPSDPEMFDALAAAQALVGERVSISVEGPYVAWGDLVVPPMAVQRPWVVDGEYHVDGESFEINPITWYTLAVRGIALRGDGPDRLGVHVDLGERRSWVRENLQTYWRGVGERLASAIEVDPASETADGAVLEWVALGVARMLYTWETGDVTSKSAAGAWAAGRAPDFGEMLHAAVQLRATPGEATRAHLLDAAAFTEVVVDSLTSGG